MVYTTILEPFHYPKVLPIEVTVLRGARRLKLSSMLRTRYSDFIPKLWNILSKLGYQRYLQKIYVTLEAETVLTSSFYQLPILVAILEAVGMLKQNHEYYVIGRFLADYTLVFPEELLASESFQKYEQGMRIERFLNSLCSTKVFPEFSIHNLFPGIIFEKEAINIVKTPLPILKKLPETTFKESSVYIFFRKKQIPEQLIRYLSSIQRPKKVVLDYKTCFCEKKDCICSKVEKLTHTEQLLFLKEYSKL